ncbi:MAG: hypothetical protein HGA43_15075, partial [Nitrospirae bacterium]|nr:hypothetical protein [Nitrospirota bacterium]
GPVKKERRRREYTLAQIAGAVVQAGEMSPDALRGSGRQRALSRGRVTFTVLAKEYGYRGMEIAEYLRKDPTAVTQYARKRGEAREFIAAAEKKLAVRE